jgi:hypothetical protein
MGNAQSWLSWLEGPEYYQPKPKLVLVPPLFERDHRGRSRMAKSSYDWLFAKPALRWLFHDYLDNGARAIMRISPTEDPRISITARLANSLVVQQKGRHQVLRLGDSSAGSMTLRFQPDPTEPLTFVDVRAAAHGARAMTRFCYFDTASKVGVFGTLPLIAGGNAPGPEIGMRYSTPRFTTGAVLSPRTQQLNKFWLVGRHQGFTYGLQFKPTGPVSRLFSYSPSSADQALDAVARHVSYSVAFSPPNPAPGSTTTYGKGTFTVAVEIQRSEKLVMSFLHHQPVQRLSHNPFEDADVVGVTNYLDLGLQVTTDISSTTGTHAKDPNGATPDADLQLAAAWQANKNLMLKARMGTRDVAAAVALKAWWQPSAWLAASVGYDIRTGRPKAGLTFGIENYGNIRYERSSSRPAFGRTLVQRHVAVPEDVANEQGKGLLVTEDRLNSPDVLGHVRSKSSDYL